MCALRWAHSLHWQLREPEIISAGWSMEKLHSESQANCNQLLHGQKSLCWASCGPWMILVKRMTFQKQQGAQHCSSPWCAFVAVLQLTNSENDTCFKTESELSMIPALGSLSFLEIASRAFLSSVEGSTPIQRLPAGTHPAQGLAMFGCKTGGSCTSIVRVYRHPFNSVTVQMMTQREAFRSNLCESL